MTMKFNAEQLTEYLNMEAQYKDMTRKAELLFANKDMAKTDFIKEITKHTRQITESHDFQQQILSRGNRAITYNDNEIQQTILKSVEIWRQAGLVKP